MALFPQGAGKQESLGCTEVCKKTHIVFSGCSTRDREENKLCVGVQTHRVYLPEKSSEVTNKEFLQGRKSPPGLLRYVKGFSIWLTEQT